MSEYKNIITIEPGKRGGKPCVRGMRITVGDVLGWLASGMSHKEIIEDSPELTDEDILACLSYAAEKERNVLVMLWNYCKSLIHPHPALSKEEGSNAQLT